MASELPDALHAITLPRDELERYAQALWISRSGVMAERDAAVDTLKRARETVEPFVPLLLKLRALGDAAPDGSTVFELLILLGVVGAHLEERNEEALPNALLDVAAVAFRLSRGEVRT